MAATYPGTVPKSLVDAKGDLLVGTADNTVARKVAGIDGQVLVADSAQADGLRWGGSPAIPPGWYIGPRSAARSAATITGRAGAWLYVEAESQPVDQLVWEVTVGGDAAAVINVGLYRPRLPSSLTVDRVLTSGAVAATAAVVHAVAISATLGRGWYLAVAEESGHSAISPTIRWTASGQSGVPLADLTDLLSDPRGGVHANALSNAASLPASFALIAGAARTTAPIIGLRTA
jgi:hypothetical protein